jgi:MFS family permease
MDRNLVLRDREKQMGDSAAPAAGTWLNRTVWGMALTSFFSDLGHEAQSTLLPTFLAALGCPPLALGAIEGMADAASSFMKLGAGWISDRLPRRKPIVVAGYAATGLASGLIALAQGWPMVMGGKLFGWFGRGIRGPLRDAMLSDAIPKEARGRAFGFHRAGDTVGAILGPLAIVFMLGWGSTHGRTDLAFLRTLMAWTVIPGLIAAGIMAWIIREKSRVTVRRVSLRHALAEMPGSFRRYLVGVGLFGAGDYAHTLLILAATQLLAPTHGTLRAAALGGLLYVWHNIVYAAAAYPAGHLSDKIGHKRILGFGYALSAFVPLMLIGGFSRGWASLPLFAAIFGLAGLVNGIQDTLEGATTSDLVPAEHRGLGFGLLGAVNGVGDLVSSLAVGALWTLNPTLGFGFATLMMALGAAVMLWRGRDVSVERVKGE